jgi:hypothetical protein
MKTALHFCFGGFWGLWRASASLNPSALENMYREWSSESDRPLCTSHGVAWRNKEEQGIPQHQCPPARCMCGTRHALLGSHYRYLFLCLPLSDFHTKTCGHFALLLLMGEKAGCCCCCYCCYCSNCACCCSCCCCSCSCCCCRCCCCCCSCSCRCCRCCCCCCSCSCCCCCSNCACCCSCCCCSCSCCCCCSNCACCCSCCCCSCSCCCCRCCCFCCSSCSCCCSCYCCFCSCCCSYVIIIAF